MTWNEAKSLDESLSSLERFFDLPPKIAEILTGGLTNRCWKITSHHNVPYVWRSVSNQLFYFSVSRQKEHQVLQALKECHFAPDPIYLSDQGLLVEWIEGSVGEKSLTESQLIRALCTIHDVTLDDKSLPLFSFTAKVDGYWHKLNPKLKTANREKIYNQFRTLPAIATVDPVLCHFDLAGYNIVTTKQGLKIIDWEYAAVGDPRMDLAMAIELSDLNITTSVASYCQRRQIGAVDDWIDGVDLWIPRNKMMAMLWYLIGYQLWQDVNYLNQAMKIETSL
ncbi:phosphotransferase [Vibrio sp. TH_r3]|uniref:phosphotransferase n=1 Tax=Vibrio sp. TH_r3 TaxID=3082084 RepID=UPI0029553B03|nr:phosphotransferase [Vibrio sp. TH_r3]MDV7103040.1 phosphotransferase [Vibrio sp. TH_r3]